MWLTFNAGYERDDVMYPSNILPNNWGCRLEERLGSIQQGQLVRSLSKFADGSDNFRSLGDLLRTIHSEGVNIFKFR